MKRALLLLALASCGATDSIRTSNDGRVVTIEQGTSRVHLEIADNAAPASRAAIVVWVKDALRAVTAFYGRIPVDEVRIIVTQRPGEGLDNGVTRFEDGMLVIRMPVGVDAGTKTFREDWVLTHELVHTAFPNLDRTHHWLEEGLATYIEPIARVRAGLEDDSDVWRQLVEGLPQGQPRRNDRGLDRTHTWGRTYWGGALFCMMADVGIRERTANKLGLRDALVALVNDGWTMTRSEDIEAVLARMDAAVGVPVLTELYAQHSNAGVKVDLDGLWKRLGIAYDHGQVTFDDTAPEAALRRAITH